MRASSTILLTVCSVALLSSCATAHFTQDSTFTVVSLVGADFRLLDSPDKKFDAAEWHLDDHVESAFIHALEVAGYRTSPSTPKSRDLLKDRSDWDSIRAVAQAARADYVVVIDPCRTVSANAKSLFLPSHSLLVCKVHIMEGRTGYGLNPLDTNLNDGATLGSATGLPRLPIERIDLSTSAPPKKRIEDTRDIFFGVFDSMAQRFAYYVLREESGCGHFWCKGTVEERVERARANHRDDPAVN